jgi:hypothetical protein
MTTIRSVSWTLWLVSTIVLTLLFIFEFSYGIPLLKFIQSDATRSAFSFNRYSINLFLSGVLRSPLGFMAILPFISLLSWFAFLQLYRSNPVRDLFKNVVLCIVSSGILLWIMTEFAIYMAVLIPLLLSKGTP